MKIIIENGATIIKTGDPNGGVKNKYNKTGVSKYIGHSKIKYRAEIQVNKKTYYLGLRSTPEEAHELRLEADKALENGTFDKWFKEFKQKSIRNKHHAKGISTRKYADGSLKYEVVIHVKKKKYYLGYSKELEDAIALRLEAEKQLKNGTFQEWYDAKKNK